MCNYCFPSGGSFGVLLKATENAFGKFPPDVDDYVKWQTFHKFAEALGYSPIEFQYNDWTKDVLAQIEMLAGPNGHTLFKAMQIRKNANARSATR